LLWIEKPKTTVYTGICTNYKKEPRHDEKHYENRQRDQVGG